MPIAAICNSCSHSYPYDSRDPFDSFPERLGRKGWRLEGSDTICPMCANGRQEILEGVTIITYGLHELRHEPGRWSGLYWLWQKGGSYRGMFQLPDSRHFTSEEDAKDFARIEALEKIRSTEWP